MRNSQTLTHDGMGTRGRQAGRARFLRGLSLALPLYILAQAGSAAAQEAPLFPTRAVPEKGTIQFTLPRAAADGLSGCYIYSSALRSGLGSSEVRLDRGMLGDTQLLCFRRMGNKVAATFENATFRATGDAMTTRGARESFTHSVAAMLDITSETPSGDLVVDMAPLLSSDVIKIADALNRDGKGFRPAPQQSAIDTASLRAFPDNVEIDTVQTFMSDTPGRQASAVGPDGNRPSFIVHHSFIRLPDDGYQPRLADPRAPAFGPIVYDYGSPLGQPVAVQLAARFRLEKTDPSAARSPVKKPIVFYIDPAAPEPVRSALREGVDYWKQSFDRAGYIDAFRTEILPEGADPMDIRYNMVHWTNRLTRGWSYGGGIIDPRTGEIIRGNVVLGALRVRQDIAIFEGLVGTAENGTGSGNDPVRAALDRIRQLGAHEVGHALGFMHNFAGSTQDRTSVMDYPPPRIKLTNGQIDLSDAYAQSGGVWDDFSVDWLYGAPPPGVDAEAHAAQKALAIAAAGVKFVTDIDGRSPDLPSPIASMWDDGPEPVAALAHMMAVRDVALANFGDQTLLPGEALAHLRRKFVPVWLLHRYDVDAAGKLIGGLDYEYAVRGDNHPTPAPFPAAQQRAAIAALIGTLASSKLTVPNELVLKLSVPIPRTNDIQFNNEVFANAGAAAFDPLVAADVAAQITLDSLLAPSRLTRVFEQNRRDTGMPGVAELVDAIDRDVISRRTDAVGRRIAYRALLTMAETQRDPTTSPAVAAILADRIETIGTRLAAGGRGEDGEWARYMAALLKDDTRLSTLLGQRQAVPEIPPGMPIGGSTGWFGESTGWFDE